MLVKIVAEMLPGFGVPSACGIITCPPANVRFFKRMSARRQLVWRVQKLSSVGVILPDIETQILPDIETQLSRRDGRLAFLAGSFVFNDTANQVELR
jgi:hypothetical protein